MGAQASTKLLRDPLLDFLQPTNSAAPCSTSSPSSPQWEFSRSFAMPTRSVRRTSSFARKKDKRALSSSKRRTPCPQPLKALRMHCPKASAPSLDRRQKRLQKLPPRRLLEFFAWICVTQESAMVLEPSKR